MARCIVTGRRTQFGNTVSHANNRNRRTFRPNLQKVRAVIDGKPQRVWVSTRAIKAGKIQKAPRGLHALWVREQKAKT
jgi:large subunit ribosomal protein L28